MIHSDIPRRELLIFALTGFLLTVLAHLYEFWRKRAEARRQKAEKEARQIGAVLFPGVPYEELVRRYGPKRK